MLQKILIYFKNMTLTIKALRLEIYALYDNIDLRKGKINNISISKFFLSYLTRYKVLFSV